MRTSDFFIDDEFTGERSFNSKLIRSLRAAAEIERSDAEVGAALARLVNDELERYGTGGSELLSEEDMREAILALTAVGRRLGLPELQLPFRDFTTFRSWWIRQGASGSYQARRNLLDDLFMDLHSRLVELEDASLGSSLVAAVSPHTRTGWPKVDTEIAELRRHFQNARTAQDYRAVGNDCVFVLEALSAAAYDPAKHLPSGEAEPPVASTKQRLERYIEVEGLGSSNASLRKLARAAIEQAQAVKHSSTPTRRDAGVAADSVILLSNILRRLEQDL